MARRTLSNRPRPAPVTVSTAPCRRRSALAGLLTHPPRCSTLVPWAGIDAAPVDRSSRFLVPLRRRGVPTASTSAMAGLQFSQSGHISGSGFQQASQLALASNPISPRCISVLAGDPVVPRVLRSGSGDQPRRPVPGPAGASLPRRRRLVIIAATAAGFAVNGLGPGHACGLRSI